MDGFFEIKYSSDDFIAMIFKVLGYSLSSDDIEIVEVWCKENSETITNADDLRTKLAKYLEITFPHKRKSSGIMGLFEADNSDVEQMLLLVKALAED